MGTVTSSLLSLLSDLVFANSFLLVARSDCFLVANVREILLGLELVLRNRLEPLCSSADEGESAGGVV